MVFSCRVIVIRPRETDPVPKYCVTVIEAASVSLHLAQRSIQSFRLTVQLSLNASLPLKVSIDTIAPIDNLPELEQSC